MNYMEKVAKMFGVELGDRFKIYDNNGKVSLHNYYFSDFGLMVEYEECSALRNDTLISILKGMNTIKHKPWEPKIGDAYFYVDNSGFIRKGLWYKNIYPIVYDITLYKLGNCYRTPEEAEANKDKWVKFYTSDDVLEV